MEVFRGNEELLRSGCSAGNEKPRHKQNAGISLTDNIHHPARTATLGKDSGWPIWKSLIIGTIPESPRRILQNVFHCHAHERALTNTASAVVGREVSGKRKGSVSITISKYAEVEEGTVDDFKRSA